MRSVHSARWWSESVIYHIYPRSFQDSDGDGVGDLLGIVARFDYIAELGVDAIWLSPINPSPMADFGYDVSDYMSIEPQFGTLSDFDALVSGAHKRNMRVILDLVPGHTSIAHPWFRDHPDWYIWADGADRTRPPNNWESIFGGPAWTKDDRTGRWYMHSFYPEQPELDWHNPAVIGALQGVIRFWRDRGVDGFRLDSVDTLVKDDQLRDDPPATSPFGLPLRHAHSHTEFLYSRSAHGTRAALAALREAAGAAFLVGEVYLPGSQWAPYLESLDCAFAFELFQAEAQVDTFRTAIENCLDACDGTRALPGWVTSNHDFPRLPTRVGRANERVVALLLLSLPGPVFIYQGDEIGLGDGPGADPPLDRAGRDPYRHPMQWDASCTGGFTEGNPWLAVVDAPTRNVFDQRNHADSVLAFYRRTITARRLLDGPVRFADAPRSILAFDRGPHRVLLNFSGKEIRLSTKGELVTATHAGLVADNSLPPHAGIILRR
jgi:alpha-glucosidase